MLLRHLSAFVAKRGGVCVSVFLCECVNVCVCECVSECVSVNAI